MAWDAEQMRIEGINLAYLLEHAKVYDMVCSCSGTPLVKEASASGLRAVNGLGILSRRVNAPLKYGPVRDRLKVL